MSIRLIHAWAWGLREQGQVAGVGVDAVLHEGLFPARQAGGVHLLAVLADVPEVGPELGGGGFGVAWVRQALRGDARRVVELLVARAAAEGAREGVLHLVLCRFRAALQQGVKGKDHGRSAVAALDAGCVYEGSLHDGEPAVPGEEVHGVDLSALDLGGKQGAGVDRSAVQDDGAQAAGSLPVAAVPHGDDALAAQGST